MKVLETHDGDGSVQNPTAERPPYSYMAMIQFAINSSQSKRMTLKEIYTWIEEHFPYYRASAKPGWKVLFFYCSRRQFKTSERSSYAHFSVCRIPSDITSLCMTCLSERHHRMIKFLCGRSGLKQIDASLLIKCTR